MALNDDKKWKGAPYQMRPVTPYKMEAPAPVVQRVVPAVEKPAPVAAKPAPVAAKPAAPKPGAFARGVADTIAFANDAIKAPPKALIDGVNRAAVGVLNVGRQGIGMAPVQPRQFNYTATQDKLAEVRAQNAAAQSPAARPQIKFAGADTMPDSMFKSPIQAPPQRQAPSQRMTLDQAHAAEVNARTATQPSSPQPGMGVPAGAGGAAPGGIVKSKDRNGNTVYTGTGAYAATGPAIAGTIGSVQNQNFGNPVVPQAQASIAQPRVASTFGMSVNDPRINDQTAPVARPQGSFRGPDAMAEAYNSREDREARQKQLSDLDSQRFRLEMIAGNPGRRGRAAIEALGQNAQQQAALIAAGEKLSADAVQGRANRNNVLANTGMEQAGQTTRQRMAGDVASQGQFLDYDARNRATAASLIEKPQYVTDAQGRYLRVGPDGAAPVTDAAGNAIQMPQTQQDNSGAVQPKDAAALINKELASLINNPPEMGGDATAYNARIAELRAQQAAYLGGGQQAKPSKPDITTFLARAKAQGSKMTEEQLKAAYANL